MEKELIVNEFASALVFALTKGEVKMLEILAEALGILGEVKTRIDKKYQENLDGFVSLDEWLNELRSDEYDRKYKLGLIP